MDSVAVFDGIAFAKGASELDACTVIYVRLGVRPRLLRFLATSLIWWRIIITNLHASEVCSPRSCVSLVANKRRRSPAVAANDLRSELLLGFLSK